MKLSFEEYSPATPPERMLAAIRREAGRRRRRRLVAGGLSLCAFLGISIGLLSHRPLPPAPPPAVPPPLAIRSVEHGGNPVPYTLVTLPGGQACVVVRTVNP